MDFVILASDGLLMEDDVSNPFRRIMAESVPSMADSSAAASIQIVYTKRPQDKEPEAYHIRTLASVLGSEDAAKEALLYNYNTVASGFSAKLTPQQAEQISTHRGVRWLASYGKHLLS
uniref:Inhibitor I9 domain-containing protein n=1 Tax=Salix viminalis TaxID=40686 RepID=A0A6N2M040_SALVM